MNDVTVADWSVLVAARVEFDRAELGLDDAMRCPTDDESEKTCITEQLEEAFDRMRTARAALTRARGTISDAKPDAVEPQLEAPASP